MRLNDYAMAVTPGNGLVGRFPNAALLLVDHEDSEELNHLLELFAAHPRVGDGLPARIEELFAGDSVPAVSAFAAVVERPDGVSLYLYGAVEVAADSTNAELRAWGPSTRPLQRYDAPADTDSLTVRCASEPLSTQDDVTLSLRSGVVSGRGLVLRSTRAEPSERMDAETAAGEPAMSGAPTATGMGAMSGNGRTAVMAPPMRGTATARPAKPQATTPVSTPYPPAQAVGQHPPAASAPPPETPRTPAATTIPTPPPWQNRSTAATSSSVSTAKPASGAINPSFGTRLLARLLLSATLGVAAALVLGALLPVGFAPLGEVYTSLLVSVGLLAVVGAVVFDGLYSLAQSRRAARDWPAALAVAQAVPEAVAVYFVQALVLPQFVVDEFAVGVTIAVVAVLISAGLLVLRSVPGVRSLVVRGRRTAIENAEPATATSAHTAPAPSTAGMAAGSAHDSTATVWGVNCQRGHFNRPDARYCGTCGTAMHGLTREPRQGPRPPLGYLVTDDGATHQLDGDYLVGQAPETDARVREGLAKALPVTDPEGQVGAVHAEVRLDQWDVTLVDCGLSSGTQVREPESAAWVRLIPGQPFTVVPGTRIQVGSRSLTFHGANHR